MSVRICDFAKDLKKITIRKSAGEKDVSTRAAFGGNQTLRIIVSVPRAFGIYKVFLCMEIDGREALEIPFSFESIISGCDEYSVTLDFAILFPKGSGLLFWQIKLVSDIQTYYTNSINNVDFKVKRQNDGKKFRILVYDKEFVTPKWAKKGVMYQIFVDRFCKGTVEVPVRNDARKNDDWYNGIPEYSEHGEPIENNTHFGGTLYGVAENSTI